jgi:hypothetical protein
MATTTTTTLAPTKVDTGVDSDSDDINDIAVTSLFNHSSNNNDIIKSEDVKPLPPNNNYFQQTLLMPIIAGHPTIHPSAYIQYNSYGQVQGFTTLSVCVLYKNISQNILIYYYLFNTQHPISCSYQLNQHRQAIHRRHVNNNQLIVLVMHIYDMNVHHLIH